MKGAAFQANDRTAAPPSIRNFAICHSPSPFRTLSSLLCVEFIGQRLRLSASDKWTGGVGGEGASNLSVSAYEAFDQIAAYLAVYDNVSDVELDARLHGI
jgi:hypothetical protein